MEKLIITCALTGAEVTKEQNPAVPYTVEEMALSAYEAYQAGASVIHVHARTDDGKPTHTYERFKAIVEAIQMRCPDVIIQLTTGGAIGMSRDERLTPIQLNPEMATLDCGTLNFGGDDIFVNTENDIIYMGQFLENNSVYKEIECFEKGHVDTVLRLVKKGLLHGPLHFSFVLGVNGGMSGEVRDFLFMKDSIPNDATYSVAGIGRYEFLLAEQAIIQGGHVRVGLEDNLYVEKGVLASSNAQLVSKVVEMAKRYNREIATPDEARQILKMKR